MRFTPDLSRGSWIGDRLEGWGTVGSTVGHGWEAYARILHRPDLRRIVNRNPPEYEDLPVTWRMIADRRGIAWGPDVQWQHLAADGNYLEADLQIGDPAVGNLGAEDLAVLAGVLARHTASPRHATAGFWPGWGDLHSADGSVLMAVFAPAGIRSARRRVKRERAAAVSRDVARAIGHGPMLELPGRQYVLLDCSTSEFTDPSWGETAGVGWTWGSGPTPSLLWPHDREWLMATEIDYDSTLVGGSRALVDEILGSPLEAIEAVAETSLALTP